MNKTLSTENIYILILRHKKLGVIEQLMYRGGEVATRKGNSDGYNE